MLVSLGFSGAWIGNLTVLEPYRPIFIGVAVLSLVFAWRRIYRRREACASGEICSIPRVRFAYQVMFWAVATLALVALVFPHVVHWLY